MKMVWFSPTSFVIRGFNLLVRNFFIGFTVTLQRAMGQKWDIFSGPSCLGTRAMWDSFICCGTLPISKACYTNSTTEGPTISQFFWQKQGSNPSGPRAFKLPIWNVAARISGSDTLLFRLLKSVELSNGNLHDIFVTGEVVSALTLLSYKSFWLSFLDLQGPLTIPQESSSIVKF